MNKVVTLMEIQRLTSHKFVIERRLSQASTYSVRRKMLTKQLENVTNNLNQLSAEYRLHKLMSE